MGAGKQADAFLVVATAHWGCALPSAVLLAFKLRLGVEGLYLGMFFGPVLLLGCYGTLVWRTPWEQVAEQAHRRVLAAHEAAAAARAGSNSEDSGVVIDPSGPVC